MFLSVHEQKIGKIGVKTERGHMPHFVPVLQV